MSQCGIAEKEKRPCAVGFGRAFGKHAAQESVRMCRGADGMRQTQGQKQSGLEIKAGLSRFFSLFVELRTEGLREQDFEASQSVADMQAASICAGSSRSAASQEPICSRRNWAAVSAHACS